MRNSRKLVAALTASLLTGVLLSSGDARAQIIHWMDGVDGGDDPWNPGCHYSYTDFTCGDPAEYIKGDVCDDGGIILMQEWTDQSCHPPQPLDFKSYDCDALCAPQGLDGICEIARGYCVSPILGGPTVDSGYCVCIPSDGDDE